MIPDIATVFTLDVGEVVQARSRRLSTHSPFVVRRTSL